MKTLHVTKMDNSYCVSYCVAYANGINIMSVDVFTTGMIQVRSVGADLKHLSQDAILRLAAKAVGANFRYSFARIRAKL